MVSAPYITKLLADQGADVIKVEAPTGDPARLRGPFPGEPDKESSGLFIGLNTNKRSVVIDVQSDRGRHELRELIASADIVVHNLDESAAVAGGFDGPTLINQHPGLVVCAISPFGRTGPYTDYRGEELTSVHGGGWGWLVPGDSDAGDLPPLKVFGHFASLQAALGAALATLAALEKAQLSGVGEYIDASVQAHVASMLEAAFVAWSYRGEIAGRSGGHLLSPWKILQAKDGLIFLVTVEDDQWGRLIDMMGGPDWAELEIFATFADRAENQDVLHIYIEEWTKQHTVEELFHQGQSQRICFAPVLAMADLEAQAHLIDREFFHQLEQPGVGLVTHLGSPYVATPNNWALRTPAPKLGEHTGQSFAPTGSNSPPPPTRAALAPNARPLAGVRIVDFSWVWAGPYCTLNLSHLGAEVIKVESSTRPGLGRRLPVSPLDVEVTLNTSGYFNQWDQGKKSVDFDLSTPEGLKSVHALIATADVVVDNYATGVMDRLGLSDATLRELNPHVIIASITGFGHTGPLRQYMGYGPTTAPLSGLASMTGYVDGPPREAGVSVGDPAAGLTAAFGIAAALIHRRRTGEPTRIDASLWESTAVNGLEGWMTHAISGTQQGPIANRDPLWAPHGCFRCVDDGAGNDMWVAIACTSDAEWSAIADVLSLAHDDRFATAAGRKANEDELDALVTEWTTTRDRWDITEQLQAAGVAAYPSLTTQDIEANAQLQAREFFTRFDHPEVGVRTHTGVPWRMHNSPNGVVGRAPLIGEHTSEIREQLASG